MRVRVRVRVSVRVRVRVRVSNPNPNPNPNPNQREGDLLQLDFSRLAAEKGGRLSVISNTPFYLTSALLFKMLGALDEVGLVRGRGRV